MINRKRKKIILHMISVWFLLPFFFLSCVSQPDAESDLNRVNMASSAEVFVNQGLAYLGDPGEDRFIRYINANSSAYPDMFNNLLETYAKKQRWTIGRFIENNDFFNARFHFNNLYAVTLVGEEEQEKFYREQLYLAGKNNLQSMIKYLKIAHQDTLPADMFEPMKDVNDYINILAEVYVDRTYTSRSKIKRRDQPMAMGSGILIDEHHILTAYHVIEHVFYDNTLEYNIFVKLQDKTVDKVKVLAWNSLIDLAILETGESFSMETPFYKLLGNSDTLNQGFEVYCLGHHEGYTATLTKGIISSPKRKAPEAGSWIQIDATMTPGASGGMLIGRDNLIYGLLVAGIMYEDINFVIPSNLILGEIDRLLSGKNTNNPWLGLMLKEDEAKKQLRIRYVFPSSPLNGLGIHMEDTLVSINGIRLNSIEMAQDVIGSLETGNIVKLLVLKPDRKIGQYYTLLSQRPDYALFNGTWFSDRIGSLFPYFGIALAPKVSLRQTLNTDGNSTVVSFHKVLKVEKDSYFANMGVKIGDSIGILFDEFEDLTRHLQVIHLPKGKTFRKLRNPSDYIYYTKRDKYDESIL